jgi:hypothetical protein
MCFIIARSGRVPEGASSAQPSRVCLSGSMGKPGFKILRGFNPVCPQRGPYEASEGIYPSHGQG